MKLFLTGATGFIGRELTTRLLAGELEELRCLARDVSRLPADARLRPVPGSLDATSERETAPGDESGPGTPAGLEESLRGCDVVVHLAALTGKASAERHRQVNVDGTARLLAASRRAGVPRFVHVSTIAVTYPEKRHYPYARSKEEAERLVRESGLDWAILRPTVVCGPGSPVAKLLAALATAPVMPLFGGGRSLVQPVHVDDVAAALAVLAAAPSPGGRTIDFGGRDVLSFADFLGQIRRALLGRDGPPLSVPLWPMVELLGWMEPALLRLLPVTAGQFYAFRHDGAARDDPQDEPPRSSRRGVDEIVEEIRASATQPAPVVGGEGEVSDGDAPGLVVQGDSDRDRLDIECSVFARYLAGVEADETLRAHYRRAHEPGRHGPVDASTDPGRGDDPLVAFARRGTHAARLADSWAALFDRAGLLRRKLALMLAMLESRAATSGRVDGPTTSSLASFAVGAMLRVAAFTLALPIAAILLLPRRIRRAGSGAGK